MSPFPAASPARRRRRAAVTALAGAAAAVALLPAPGAQAAFTTGKCQGASIIGRGASFAATAHTSWINNFTTSFCLDVGSAPGVTYEAQGSGAGRRAVGERTGTNADGSQSRNQPPRFGMTDEPPTPAGQAQMNLGTDAVGDEGKIHVIPAAAGSVVTVVNWPDNCDRTLLPAGSRVDAAAVDQTDRIKFTRAEFEAVWNGDAANDTWAEVFPTLNTDTDCQVPIKRVVRFDDSGTSFAFKDYLRALNNGRGWLTTYITPDTRTWPNATVSSHDCDNNAGTPNVTGPNGPNLVTGCANGNGALMDKVNATDGSIGYADLATARSKGFQITPNTSDNDKFWIPVANASAAFAEPTADAASFKNGNKGANCNTVAFNNIPSAASSPNGDPTLGDWAPVSGVDPASGYPICTLTFGLVFDDNAPVWGNTAAEEQKARSVKDYWTNVVGIGGQSILFANDYSPLPLAIQSVAAAGIASVGWNKAGDAAGGGGGTPPPPPPPGGGGTPPPPPPARPSNAFSIPTATVAKNGNVTIGLRLPGAGRVVGAATASVKSGRRTVRRTVGSLQARVSRAGTVRVTVRLNAAGKAALRKVKRLRVTIRVTFTPTGGAANSRTKVVTIKGSAK